MTPQQVHEQAAAAIEGVKASLGVLAEIDLVPVVIGAGVQCALIDLESAKGNLESIQTLLGTYSAEWVKAAQEPGDRS